MLARVTEPSEGSNVSCRRLRTVAQAPGTLRDELRCLPLMAASSRMGISSA
jgi:hypothetical protein